MSAMLAVTPNAPIPTQTAVNIDVVGNVDDATQCYILVDNNTGDDHKSQLFSGNWTWMGLILDQVDAVTVRLRKASDDSDIVTIAL